MGGIHENELQKRVRNPSCSLVSNTVGTLTQLKQKYLHQQPAVASEQPRMRWSNLSNVHQEGQKFERKKDGVIIYAVGRKELG
jgi:hypothetical protein